MKFSSKLYTVHPNLREAGLLQAPPRMVEEVFNWAAACIAKSYLEGNFRSESSFPESRERLAEIALLHRDAEAIPYKSTVTKRFDLDLRGWRYDKGDFFDKLIANRMETAKSVLTFMDEKEKEIGHRWDVETRKVVKNLREQAENDLKALTPDKLPVSLQFGSSQTYHSWLPGQNRMELNYRLGFSFDHLKESIRHEMVHMAQSLLSQAADSSIKHHSRKLIGGPKRGKRTPEYQQAGGDLMMHSLDDVEFHPLLVDAVAAIQRAIRGKSLPDQKSIFKSMTAQKGWSPRNPAIRFFSDLKKVDKVKYRHALSKAYTEIFG